MVTGQKVANESLNGNDVVNNTLKGADIDEGTLDIGNAARAYARVSPVNCTGTPGTCTPEQSKGISSVTREQVGRYCVAAPGIDSDDVTAAVTVDWSSTVFPGGNASAMTREATLCGPTDQGFRVVTERQPLYTVDAGGGTHNRTVSGPAEDADDVAFTIVIP